MIDTYRGAVYHNQLDHMGHMNVQYYTSMFDQATWHLFNEVGLTPTYFKENDRAMAAAEQTFKYKKELFPGDVVHIKSKVLEVKNRAFLFLHTMYDSETGDEVASTNTVAVHLDTTIRNPCPLPDAIKVAMKKLIE